jgi:carboxypeptidase C (cathepsin A)
MRHTLRLLAVAALLCSTLLAQEKNPPAAATEQKPAPQSKSAKNKPATPTTEPEPAEQSKETAKAQTSQTPEESAKPEAGEKGTPQNVKYDMTEVPPVVTHHQITADGRVLHYTATAGRMPIKNEDGKIEAEMFFVAYTLDGAAPGTRPLTFAFNGGPGSASIWLHMGALGPRKVVLEPEGWMPPAPYHLEDNPYTPLDRTDLVLVDAIGTGFSRPADTQTGKKFWSVKGDIASFGEFIRMYITRNERWSSPLYLLGESYGTTRSAGLSGYLEQRGISFNGIVLLSTILRFGNVETTPGNDLAYIDTLPTYTMIAWYHKKLAADLMQDQAKTRAEVEQWAITDYAAMLRKGDNMTPEERKADVAQIARYIGLTPQDVDEANLRVDVRWFTHRLLAGQKLRVGRLDGRYAAPDPEGYLDTPFYDPTAGATTPPFTSMFNDYIRRDLNYKTDMNYNVMSPEANRQWNWGNAAEGMPETAGDLRAAMVKDPYLKVLVMEGYYDLATPYFSVNDTMNHMDLPEQYRKNLLFATFECGHMVYLRQADLKKMKQDFVNFIGATTTTK